MIIFGRIVGVFTLWMFIHMIIIIIAENIRPNSDFNNIMLHILYGAIFALGIIIIIPFVFFLCTMVFMGYM